MRGVPQQSVPSTSNTLAFSAASLQVACCTILVLIISIYYIYIIKTLTITNVPSTVTSPLHGAPVHLYSHNSPSCALHYPHLGYPVLFTTLIWAILCFSLPSSGLSCALYYPHLSYPVLFTTLSCALHYPHLNYPACALHYPHLGYPVLFTTLI